MSYRQSRFIVVAAVTLGLLLPGTQAFAFGPTVETDLGVIRGERDDNDTLVWRGVPYARPPVGDLRWKAPRPVEPWEGVLNARRFSEQALQYSAIFANRVIGSEDCLYLNIWRPETSERDLPVYVWIHGGGNSMGSASQVPDYHGDAVAGRSNLVFVSINYRLGPFGWMRHPSFSDEADPRDRSGNYGTLDIIAALQWIRDNIEAFGGDPDTVLISGESAGAMNVLSLLISQEADGLFSHAMIQSGVARIESIQDAETIGNRLESALASGAMATGETFREAMADVSGRDIMRVFEPRGFGMLGLPNIFADGFVLPAEGYDVLETGEYPARVPVIIGSNQEEMKLFLAGNRELRRDPELYQAVTRTLSDDWKIDGVDSVARLLANVPDQPPVYAYHFRWGAPNEQGESEMPERMAYLHGSFHSLEIPFFLGTGTIHGPLSIRYFRPSNRDGREALTGAMMSYVERFIRTGAPDVTGLPEWESWSNVAGAAKSIILDARDEELSIEMMYDEYTDEYLRQFVTESYEPHIADAVLQWLESNRW